MVQSPHAEETEDDMDTMDKRDNDDGHSQSKRAIRTGTCWLNMHKNLSISKNKKLNKNILPYRNFGFDILFSTSAEKVFQAEMSIAVELIDAIAKAFSAVFLLLLLLIFLLLMMKILSSNNCFSL